MFYTYFIIFVYILHIFNGFYLNYLTIYIKIIFGHFFVTWLFKIFDVMFMNMSTLNNFHSLPI